LQAQQMSLQEIQRQLLGLSEEALYELAKLPPPAPVTLHTRQRHWAALPIPLELEKPLEVKSLFQIRLTPTVSLSIEGLSQTPKQEQLRKIQEAAKLLLEQIEALQNEI
jgi:hypothetical protein